MSQIKLSVLMAVYNAEKYLKESIESVLRQTYTKFEFIIINDGSSDNTQDILNEFLEQDDRIILVNQEENIGLTKSLNKGLSYVSGDYVVRQDGDDLSMEKRFEVFINYEKTNHDVIVYSTPSYLIDNESNILKTIPNFFRRNGFHPKMLNYYNSLIHGSLIISTKIIKEYLYDGQFKYSQDFDLYHRLIKSGYKIDIDTQNLNYMFRSHKRQISHQKSNQQLLDFKKILKKNNLKYYNNSKLVLIIDFYFFLLNKVKAFFVDNN